MKTKLASRSWVPARSEALVQQYAQQTSDTDSAVLAGRIEALAQRNKAIHEQECFNLNPAANVMNPRAEALLASGLSTRPSLGYPGDKYETGLEATEEVEVIAAQMCAEVFDASYAEIRVASGAMANLYAFMACCQPGDSIIVPPASIGGHVTHHRAGCAGLFGLNIHEAPVDPSSFSVDVDGLRQLARRVNPSLITLGGSLNLLPHPVATVREIADEAGASLLFDAAHQCGIIAGGVWPNPLADGVHLMTMSTYKSLGGPAGGLIVSNDAALMQKIDAIAFPGMTANFDAAKSAALAMGLLDWREHGADYAQTMVDVARELAAQLQRQDVDIFTTARGATESHQFAVRSHQYGGGQAASARLRQAGFLACGIGLPEAEVSGDLNGIRFGTPDVVRFGVGVQHCEQLATLLASALTTEKPETMAAEVAGLREQFNQLHFIN
jgi:glycine hydroxymethyltransferase